MNPLISLLVKASEDFISLNIVVVVFNADAFNLSRCELIESSILNSPLLYPLTKLDSPWSIVIISRSSEMVSTVYSRYFLICNLIPSLHYAVASRLDRTGESDTS